MQHKDLLIRIYHKDLRVVLYPDKITNVNVARQRVSISHPKSKGDLLFDKCIVMRSTGFEDEKYERPIYELDLVNFVAAGENKIGRVVFEPKVQALMIDTGEEKFLLSDSMTLAAHDLELIQYIKENLVEEDTNAKG